MLKNVNKRLLILISGLVLLALIGIFYFYVSQKNFQINNIKVEKTSLPLKKMPSTKSYSDESGFTFNYPQDLHVAKVNTPDNAVYSNLKITSSVPGEINIKVSDTKYSNLKTWEKETPGFFGKGKDVKLGSMEARKYETKDKVSIIAIDGGIIFSVEVNPQKDKEFWSSAYSTIISSFSFYSPQSSTQSETEEGIGDNSIIEEGSDE